MKNLETSSLLVSAQFIQEVPEADTPKDVQMWWKCREVALVPGKAKIRGGKKKIFFLSSRGSPGSPPMGM